jgi:hypothetical protein
MSCIRGCAWLIRRVLDLMIEFIGPLYNWLQQFPNHYLIHCILLPTEHSTETILTSNWTELNCQLLFASRYIGSPHKNPLKIQRSSFVSYGKALWLWKIRTKDFDGFAHFQHPQNTNVWFLECRLSLSLSASLLVRLASAWTARRILFIFYVKNFCRRSVLPDEYLLSSSKRKGP